MSSQTTDAKPATSGLGWTELWRKEDWWAVWIGLATALIAYALFASGSSIAWLAVSPAKWAAFPQLLAHFETNAIRYIAQFAVLLGLFSIAASAIGYSVEQFVPGFVLVYVLSVRLRRGDLG